MNCDPQQFDIVAGVICAKPANETPEACFAKRRERPSYCRGHDKCRLAEMTKPQLDYVLHPLETESYLKACPGSGKTESIALKAAYMLRARQWSCAGVAFLTFTNKAADVIVERVRSTHGESLYPHYVGTFDSWLHGYVLNPFGHRETKYPGENDDRSVSVIDSHASAPFLHAYKCDPGLIQGAPVLAHQFFYEIATNKISFDSDSRGLDEKRKNLNWTGKQLDELKRIKQAFWKAGFATHADVQTICFRVLHASSDLRVLVARRFPFVIVDECQDLSPNQLWLLDELRRAGTKVHVVGDVNQAIYSFRKSDPKLVQDFVAERSFTTLALSTNIRSVQPIVDTCGQIVGHGTVTGRPPAGTNPACVYFVYATDALPKLVERFEALVRDRGIDPSKCLVLGRGKKLVAQIGLARGALPTSATERLAYTIHLWRSGAHEFRDEALQIIGETVADAFFPHAHADTRRHSCPRTYASAMTWRVSLARVLDSCVVSRMGNFDQTWTKWAAVAKVELPSIVESLVSKAQGGDEVSFRAPKGKKGKLVCCSFANLTAPNLTKLRASTIHAAKGETAEAVLVVSSKDGRGRKGGFWHDWLDRTTDDGEHARFAYVASSRPRELLAWAIPKLSKGDAETLKGLGFHPVPQPVATALLPS